MYHPFVFARISPDRPAVNAPDYPGYVRAILVNEVFDREVFAERGRAKIDALAAGPYSLGLIRRAIWAAADNP